MCRRWWLLRSRHRTTAAKPATNRGEQRHAFGLSAPTRNYVADGPQAGLAPSAGPRWAALSGGTVVRIGQDGQQMEFRPLLGRYRIVIYAGWSHAGPTDTTRKAIAEVAMAAAQVRRAGVRRSPATTTVARRP